MKKLLYPNICLILLSLFFGLTLISCIYENEEPGTQSDENVEVVLKISTLAATDAQSGVTEKLKSLRLIMISSSGRLAVNEDIQLPYPEYTASQFVYTLRKTIPSGNWKVFLVGNEGSVGNVKLADPSVAPKGMPVSSLTAMLNSFVPEAEVEGREDYTGGTTLEKVLNSVYFKNDNVGSKEGASVYLPYSAYYDLNVKYHSKVSKTMYLVPVAAKFDFVFKNYRKKDIKIDDIELSGFNTHNYLNALLDPKEQTRKLNGVDTWWIDWLEACSKASETTDDDVTFNKGWGWIEKYSLPVPDEDTWMKQLNPGKERWVVGRLVDAYNPTTLPLGPFYVPESINLKHPEGLTEDQESLLKDGEQSYWVTFYLHETTDPVVTKLANYQIDTVKTLFRATHVIVYVELYESKVEIYAEIHEWNKSHFIGYLKQEDDE